MKYALTVRQKDNFMTLKKLIGRESKDLESHNLYHGGNNQPHMKKML